MSEWAKELLADVADEQWDNEVEMTFAAREHLLRVLERRLLGLLEAGQAMRDGYDPTGIGKLCRRLRRANLGAKENRMTPPRPERPGERKSFWGYTGWLPEIVWSLPPLGFCSKFKGEKMKYIANPVEVEAHKIVSVGKANADCSVNVALENGENEIATSAMCSRMAPVPGDYWVIQSDGYVYLNPKDVFERKYRAA